MGCLVGKTQSYVKISMGMVDEIKKITWKDGETMLSFDVVSLYTKIPIEVTIDVIKEIMYEDTIERIKVCLKSTFFTFQDCSYDQIESVSMGSPFSPIVARLFMEKFEKITIDSYPLKPKTWKIYVDDTNVIWSHGEEIINGFFKHVNNKLESIKFTMEDEENKSIHFLDILVTKKDKGGFSHQFYRKKTHTDLYLHSKSHHNFAQKISVINTLDT